MFHQTNDGLKALPQSWHAQSDIAGIRIAVIKPNLIVICY